VLFGGHTRLVERLAACEDPLGRARELLRALPVGRTRREELQTAVDELVAIAVDRYRRSVR
jgi:hypothetical protein